MEGQVTVGNKSVRDVFLGDDRVVAIYYGSALVYQYGGFTLQDSAGNDLLDSEENNLISL